MLGAVRQENSSATAPQSPDGNARDFGLARLPFKQTANPRFLFESASYRAVLKDIASTTTRGESIIVVTGASGTGKTTLCRAIAEHCGPRTIVAIVSRPPATESDLIRQILAGFGILTGDTSRVVQASQSDLLRVLHQFLTSLVPLHARAILVFDEAQRFQPDVLEQIRRLLNLDPDHQRLQIILVAQPELHDLLSRRELRQVDQLVSRRYRLEPLQVAEVFRYVDRRLSVAHDEHGTGELPKFTASAIEAITTLSRRVPRVINSICDRALEKASRSQPRIIDNATVLEAARSLNIDMPLTARVRLSRRYARAFLAATFLLAAVPLWTLRNSSILAGTPRGAVEAGVVHATKGAATRSYATLSMVPTPGAVVGSPKTQGAPQNAVEADRFLIVVSSFRTDDRSTKVATDITALGLPAFVRRTSDWYQVLVGPYGSRQEAVAAQNRLASAHISDTTLWPSGRQPAAAAPAAARSNAPASDIGDLALDNMVRRADALARQPNVKAVQQIREQIISRQQAAAGPTDSSAFASALRRVDQYLDDARRRQLEEDGRRLAAAP